MKTLRRLLSNLITNKRILILGFGREGESTLKKVLEGNSAASVTVSDANDVSERVAAVAAGANVNVISGPEYLKVLKDYDVVFKSPGVVLKDGESTLGNTVLTSETEVFMQAYGDRVIGITGTKGKSTTSSLIYHILKESGRDVLFGGNIGIPVFELADSVGEDTIIVLELSCHQLEYLKTDPHVAILLNIYEDHLDHYGTRERYAASKKNIFAHQGADDFLFTTKETYEAEKLGGLCKSKYVPVSLDDAPFDSFESIEGVSLIGEHNRFNCGFAYRVLKEYGIGKEEFIKALASFKPLEHRLERFLSFKGQDFYDDSISTTVKSCISAVESVKNASVLLVGGMERNIDYSELIEYLKDSKLDHVICMYESGRRIYDMLVNAKGKVKVSFREDLKAATEFGVSVLRPEGAMILSPAAASYGYFKNFEERGREFKKIVNGLLKN
ncbi:MAG: UDP-N-acetylmuramoyl-L-alanine--D-glutamate ligase [Lachnospiraceae bacterium]|nr:UDP-N-acetylmuramoyl-L-alanine--D-glutamate ligase [Lachnospiraceae bacterium]